MQNHTLLIVGGEKDSVEAIKQKAALNRDTDKIIDTNIKGTLGVLKTCKPDAILFVLDSPDEAIIGLIRGIRKIKYLSMTPIMFFVEKKYNKEFMSQAFEAGLDDFIYCPLDDTEVSIRIKMNLKRNAYIQNVENQKAIMRKFNIINEKDFYMPEFTGNIFEAFAQNSIEYGSSFIFTVFSSAPENKEELVYQLQLNSRANDAIGQLSENIFYIIMPKTDLDKAKDFYKKIKEALGQKELNSAVCKYTSKIPYKEFTTIVLKALKEASLVGDTIVNTSYLGAETFVSQVAQKKEKNYKLFQKLFEKKTQITVLPTFQHLKVHLEQKYPYNVRINFFVTETKCYFSLQHVPSEVEMSFKINNLGHSKVSLETIRSTKEQTVINSLDMDINEITDKTVAKFVNIITAEFDRLMM